MWFTVSDEGLEFSWEVACPDEELVADGFTGNGGSDNERGMATIRFPCEDFSKSPFLLLTSTPCNGGK